VNRPCRRRARPADRGRGRLLPRDIRIQEQVEIAEPTCAARSIHADTA